MASKGKIAQTHSESMRKTAVHFPGTLMRMTGGRERVLIRADENISSRSQLSTWPAVHPSSAIYVNI